MKVPVQLSCRLEENSVCIDLECDLLDFPLAKFLPQCCAMHAE